jgi:hypothetical protein
VLTAEGTVARQRAGRVLELVSSRFSVPVAEDPIVGQALFMGSLVETSKEE